MRELRAGRHLTQVDLAARLGISQGRLSEIERGTGSFTAEQFLLMLQLFNVTASHFAGAAYDHEADLQNALARLGAAHLHETVDVLPTERLQEVGEVVREALLTQSPRHLTALAPVIVRNIDRVNLPRLRVELVQVGLERRLAWVVDNTLEAVRRELQRKLIRPLAQQYRRAEAVLEMFMGFARGQAGDPSRVAGDLLDAAIGSPKTRREVEEASSEISKRWGVVTGLQPEDFVDALRAAHVQH